MIFLRFMAWWAFYIVRSFLLATIFLGGGLCHLVLGVLFIPAGFMLVLQQHKQTLSEWPPFWKKKEEPGTKTFMSYSEFEASLTDEQRARAKSMFDEVYEEYAQGTDGRLD